jgi:hypothetical protein
VWVGLDHGAAWALVALAALVLLVWLYREERRVVSRRVGRTLLALRLAAAAVLVLMLFEPVAERVRTETLRSRVVVGVDTSESMSTADPGRPAEARAQLVSALGLDGGSASRLDTMPRREVARRLLERPWMGAVGKRYDVEALGFARSTASGTLADVARAGAPPGPEGLVTDWEGVLRRGAEASDASPVAAVVLVTDGRANALPPEHPSLENLKRLGVPVYGLLVGSTVPPRDVAIAGVTAPETVEVGQSARVEVAVKAEGLTPGTAVDVRLERPGGAGALHERVTVPSDGSAPAPAVFRVPLDVAGDAHLRVAVGPIEGDVRPDNDVRPLTVTASDDQARVLLVSAVPSWEYRYLRDALGRDDRVRLETVLLRPPSLDGASEPPQPQALPAATGSDGPDPLNAFDAILLVDLASGDLEPEAWRRLDRFASERGGTIVLESGPRSALGTGVGSPGDPDDTLRSLCPVTDPVALPVVATAVDPELPALPPGGQAVPSSSALDGPWPMLQLASTVPAAGAVWASLPRLPFALTGRPKPGATVLATVSLIGSDADADASDASASTLMAAMPYGLGQVLWLGTDATWRWRFRVGDTHHHRFWGQVVRWASRDELAAGNAFVRFGPVVARVAEGEPARLRARFADPSRATGLTVAARVFRADAEGHATGEPLAVVRLSPDGERAGVYEADAPLLGPGSYVARLEAPQVAAELAAAGDASAVESGFQVRFRPTTETIELAASPDALAALAAATGGALLTESNAGRLPDLLAAKPPILRRHTDLVRLGHLPTTLGVLVVLLAAEWIVRKRAGLP